MELELKKKPGYHCYLDSSEQKFAFRGFSLIFIFESIPDLSFLSGYMYISQHVYCWKEENLITTQNLQRKVLQS